MESKHAKYLRSLKVLIWDEAPMAHRHCFEAVSRLFQELHKNWDEPFGGVVCVFGGDLRQTLPIVVREIVAAC